MSEPSTSAPVPSKHVFVHELGKQSVGAKVRFLCCVIEYDAMKGTLLVEHAYPRSASSTPRAIVNVNLVLETVKSQLLETGCWLNVMGYVQNGDDNRRRKRPLSVKGATLDGPVHVQAVLMWDAGAIKVNEYEEILEKQRDVWRKTRRLHARPG